MAASLSGLASAAQHAPVMNVMLLLRATSSTATESSSASAANVANVEKMAVKASELPLSSSAPRTRRHAVGKIVRKFCPPKSLAHTRKFLRGRF